MDSVRNGVQEIKVEVMGYDPEYVDSLAVFLGPPSVVRDENASGTKKRISKKTQGNIRGGAGEKEQSDSKEIIEKKEYYSNLSTRIAQEISQAYFENRTILGIKRMTTDDFPSLDVSPRFEERWFWAKGMFVPWQGVELTHSKKVMKNFATASVRPMGDLIISKDGNWYFGSQIFLYRRPSFIFTPQESKFLWRIIERIYVVMWYSEELRNAILMGELSEDEELKKQAKNIWKVALIWKLL